MPDQSVAPKSVIRAMIVIVTAMGLLAIYANVQRLRRDKVETVIVTPATNSSPSATPSDRSD